MFKPSTKISCLAAMASMLAFGQIVQAAPVIDAVLRLQERIPMESLAQVMKQKNSPMMRAYTADEIRAIAAPVDADYQELLQNLQASGIQVVKESPTHLWLSVKAEAQVFEQVFATQIQMNEKNERHLATAAKVPQHLGLVAAITGLSNERHARPLMHVQSKGLSDSPGGFSRETINQIYHFDKIYSQNVSGKGQHIAIATYMGFNIADVQYFYKYMNLSPMSTVDQVTFNGTPPMDENSAMETSLDAEFAGMIAPGAAVHVFASATNDDAGELQMYTAILDDGRAQVVNYSWGDCETNVKASHAQEMEKVFARAVAQGVNIMIASGDSGSDSCGNSTTIADWPAANDNVVAVGGTTILTNNGVYSETGWYGSGGGISGIWGLPSWQSGLGGAYVKRSYPDVSFNADPMSGQAVYTHQNGAAGWLVIGGTSMAAPQWSGFMALVGSARKAAGKGPLGYLNPIIYGMNSSDMASGFTDVTGGSNGAYSAGPGWDAVTGFGSPKADALLAILTSK